MKKLMAAAVAALTLSMANQALAHITLAQTEAAAGSTYKGVLQVGHGCEGAPTTSVRCVNSTKRIAGCLRISR